MFSNFQLDVIVLNKQKGTNSTFTLDYFKQRINQHLVLL